VTGGTVRPGGRGEKIPEGARASLLPAPMNALFIYISLKFCWIFKKSKATITSENRDSAFYFQILQNHKQKSCTTLIFYQQISKSR